MLQQFKITSKKKSEDKFPEEISVQFSYNDKEHLIDFIRNVEAQPTQHIDVYQQDEDGKVTKLDLDENAQVTSTYSTYFLLSLFV